MELDNRILQILVIAIFFGMVAGILIINITGGLK